MQRGSAVLAVSPIRALHQEVRFIFVQLLISYQLASVDTKVSEQRLALREQLSVNA
ncbi:MAG: hypothetical protein F6J98_42920 [Moorea sp. SIO4G2]|uniref:hypothetical protein n=1 Tax=unclassified Moorena TaxID=2683338 RepID=UPI0013F9005B|nr:MULTISPECIES: hypothetical protein [unclassified Moorena]NEO17702.1 hypothetical protein [Moorena sp. SIO3E8]NEO66768.1 hypothetical protein [Moorena sp. SIO4G2]NEP98304.1 hypothetical protein [Moorena sp. SIO3F7]